MWYTGGKIIGHSLLRNSFVSHSAIDSTLVIVGKLAVLVEGINGKYKNLGRQAMKSESYD